MKIFSQNTFLSYFLTIPKKLMYNEFRKYGGNHDSFK